MHVLYVWYGTDVLQIPVNKTQVSFSSASHKQTLSCTGARQGRYRDATAFPFFVHFASFDFFFLFLLSCTPKMNPLLSSLPVPLGSTSQIPRLQTPASSAPSVASTVSIPTRPPYPHIRSCLSCRNRKVKCDRQHPCSNCDRAGTQCTFPPGPGRAPKKPRGTRDPRLLERLWKLEDIVCRLGAELDPEDHSTENGSKVDPEDPVDAIDQEFGRLLIDDTKSTYVSHRFWASLGDEVRRLPYFSLLAHHTG